MRDIQSNTKFAQRADRRRVGDRGRGWALSALALGSLFLMLATVGGAATPAQSAPRHFGGAFRLNGNY